MSFLLAFVATIKVKSATETTFHIGHTGDLVIAKNPQDCRVQSLGSPVCLGNALFSSANPFPPPKKKRPLHTEGSTDSLRPVYVMGLEYKQTHSSAFCGGVRIFPPKEAGQ
jgi:hypothetical protein